MSDASENISKPTAIDRPADDGMEIEPIPVEVIPVEAVAGDPVPLEAIRFEAAYPRPERVGPPRSVMAMGVWSIVVASLCMVGGPSSALVMTAISTANTARAGVATSAALAPPVVSVTEVVDPAGLAAADRSAVIDGLSRARAISPAQQLQLDELLAESGREVVTSPSPVDPAMIAATITGSGQLATLGTAGAAGDDAPIYFVLADGRLELTAGRAVFFPGGGQPAIRAVAYPLPERSTDATSPPPPLSDAAIRSTLRAIARMNGARPKAAQVQAILSLLSGTGQQVVVPMADGGDPAAEVTSADTDPDGTLTIATSHGGSDCTLNVTPSGQISASLIPSGVAQPATSATSAATLGFVVILAAAQLLVAVYLLVIGILTLRRVRAGRLLHWIYVGVKLPVAAAALVAMVILARSISNGVTAIWWTVPAVLGLIYPTMLVFVLLGRSVQDYYGPADVTSGGTRYAPW